jgi:hypothetical protein
MSLSSGTSGSVTGPARDSKDFVEHLRTIHFTLMAVCLALLVVVLTPSPLSIQRASDQLNQIAETVALWNTRDWLQNEIDKMIKAKHLENICVAGEVHRFDVIVRNKPIKVASVHNLLLRPIPPYWEQRTDDKGNPRDVMVTNPPTNLADFKQSWDTQHSLFCPTRLADTMWILTTEKKETFPIQPVSLPNAEWGLIQLEEMFHLTSYGIPDSIKGYSAAYVAYTGIPGEGVLVIPVQGDDHPVDWRTALNDLGSYRWRHTNFGDAFYELDRATSGFQTLDFGTLKQILHVQANNSKEVFEAFGVKFPIETASRWGLILILGIQVYMWLHIAEYRRRKFNQSDIAWIGSYTQAGPRMLFYLTAVLLPVAVIVFVVFFQREPPLHNRFLSDVALAITVALAGLCYREHRKATLPPQA